MAHASVESLPAATTFGSECVCQPSFGEHQREFVKARTACSASTAVPINSVPPPSTPFGRIQALLGDMGHARPY